MISIATSESVWNCVTCSPLVRLCVTIRLFRHSFSRGQRLIVQRSLGILYSRGCCGALFFGRTGPSLSLFLSLVLLQQSLSAVKIVVRRKRGGSDKQSGDEQEGLARVNHTLLHQRQKTLSTCCPSPLCFIILRNREAGAE